MSFYGNISNASKTNLTFDKVYPNRATMDSAVKDDGVMIGRYVLVEYNDGTEPQRLEFFLTKQDSYAIALYKRTLESLQKELANEFDENKKKKIEKEIKEINNKLRSFNLYYCIRPIGDENMKDAPEEKVLWKQADVIGGTINLDDIVCARLQLDASYKPIFQTDADGKPIKDTNGNYIIIGYNEPVPNQYSVYYFFRAVKSLDEKGTEIAIENDTPISFEFLGYSTEKNVGWDDYTLNFNADKDYANEKQLLFPEEGWDGTVWQKSVVDGEAKYLMIASLNSRMPNITVVPEAPSINPSRPHLDQKGTNKDYILHYPTTWGFRVKESKGKSDVEIHTSLVEFDDGKNCDVLVNKTYDGDIYFNLEGFNPDKHKRYGKTSNHNYLGDNYITVLPGKSGKSYLTHNDLEVTYLQDGQEKKELISQDGTAERADVQELSIKLPALGDAVCDIYDILYGVKAWDEEKKEWYYLDKRNTSYLWGNKDGARAVSNSASGAVFSEGNLSSVAGLINSVQDLMGQIIEVSNDLERANTNTIYYVDYGKLTDEELEEKRKIGYIGPNFYRKIDKIIYRNIKNEDFDKYSTDYEAGRRYYKLEQFDPDTYYTRSVAGKDDSGYLYNYYLERNNVPDVSATYFHKDTLITNPIKLLQWAPYERDEETGEIPLPLYYKVNNNFIQVSKEDSAKDIEYYNIFPTQITYPNGDPNNSYIKTIFYNPKEYVKDGHHVYGDKCARDEITGEVIPDENGRVYYTGYFYLKEDNNNELVPVYDVPYIEGEQYYLIKNYFKDKAQGGEGVGEVDAYYAPVVIFDPNDPNYGQTIYEPLIAKNIQKYVSQFNIELIKFEKGKYYIDTYNEEFQTTDYILLTNEKDIKEASIYYQIYAEEEIKQITGDKLDNSDNPGQLIDIKFYQPNKYFYLMELTESGLGNYLLDGRERMGEDVKYFTSIKIATDKDGVELTTSGEIFYSPNKYYYVDSQGIVRMDRNDTRSVPYTINEEGKHVVDRDYTDENYIFTTEDGDELAYFRPKTVHVINDLLGIYERGALWEKDFVPPDEIQLGVRLYPGDEGTEMSDFQAWSVIQGYSKDFSTLNGIVLESNKVFEYNNTLTREDTIQGGLNKLNDYLDNFADLSEKEMVVIDGYGRIHSAEPKTDRWIEFSVDPWTYEYDKEGNIITEEVEIKNEKGEVIDTITRDKRKPIPNITLEHAEPGEPVETAGQTADKAMEFGETFTSASFGIDEKGHINSFTDSTITLPALSIIPANGNVMTGFTLNQTGEFTLEKENVGNLLLTDYKLGTSASVVETDSINSAFGKLQAQLNLLNADASTPGSISNKIFKEVIEMDDNDAVDRLTEIADWIAKDETGTAELVADVENNTKAILANKTAIETNLTNYEADKNLLNYNLELIQTTIETNQTNYEADKILLNADILALQNLVGEKSVETQISEAITAENLAQYALATELDTAEGRITAIEENIENWNKAEENVQSNWLEEDETSDAYIQNKPDLSDVVRTTDLDDVIKLDTTFDYIYSETTTAMTISTLMEKIAELEARIAILENPVNPEPEPEEPTPEPEPEPEIPEEEPTE